MTQRDVLPPLRAARLLALPQEVRNACLVGLDHGDLVCVPSAHEASPPAVRLVQRFSHVHAGGFETEVVVSERGLRRTRPPATPLFPFLFLPSTTRLSYEDAAEKFGRLERDGESGVLEEGLRILEPRLSKLFIAYQAGTPVLWARLTKGPPVPMHLLGEGAVRLGSILLLIATAQQGFVMIDEIENGLHWSVLEDMWQVVAEQARRCNTQVFATTHNWECIQAARLALTETPEDLMYHRLEAPPEGSPRVVSYRWEHLQAAAETPLEVR